MGMNKPTGRDNSRNSQELSLDVSWVNLLTLFDTPEDIASLVGRPKPP